MKSRVYIGILVGVLGTLAFLGCANPTSSGSSSITAVALNYGADCLELGSSETTFQLSATVSPSSASQTVSWSSDNTSVATVNSAGLITGITAGSAVITATASDNKTKATCAVAVWQDDGSGYLRYFNADTALYGSHFTHHPPSSWNTTSLTATTANPITVTLYKASGEADEEYGVHFFEQDANDLYEFGITTTGYYYFGKCVGGTWSTIQSWKFNSSIAQGFKTSTSTSGVNTISICQPSTEQISITINNATPLSFSDSSFSAGKLGLVVYSGEPQGTSTSSYYESFPSVPEDIHFMITSPFKYP